MKQLFLGILFVMCVLSSHAVVAKSIEVADVNIAAYASYGAYAESGSVLQARKELEKLGVVYETFQVDKHNVLIGRSATDGLYIIAIAGTESKVSLLTDLRRGFVSYQGEAERKVHEGYYALSESLIKDERIRKLLGEVRAHPSHSLLLAGHSLGGAVAIITAQSLVEKRELPLSQLSVVSFGAPLPGNAPLVASLAPLTSQFISIEGDIIPRIFQIVTKRYKGSLPNNIQWKRQESYSTFSHSMQNYLDEAQKMAALAYEDDRHIPKVKKLWIAYPIFQNQARVEDPLGEAISRHIQHRMLLAAPHERGLSYQRRSVADALHEARALGYQLMEYISLHAKTIPTSSTQSYSLTIEISLYDVNTGRVKHYEERKLTVEEFDLLVSIANQIIDMHKNFF